MILSGITIGGGTPGTFLTVQTSDTIQTDNTPAGTKKAIFGYGLAFTGVSSLTNLVSNTGVVATNTAGVGTARRALAAAGYGTDKAIFGYGDTDGGFGVNMVNLVSNTGVVATDWN